MFSEVGLGEAGRRGTETAMPGFISSFPAATAAAFSGDGSSRDDSLCLTGSAPIAGRAFVLKLCDQMTKTRNATTATKMICMTSQSKIHAHARSVIQTRRRHNESDGPDGAEDILVDSWRSLCSA